MCVRLLGTCKERTETHHSLSVYCPISNFQVHAVQLSKWKTLKLVSHNIHIVLFSFYRCSLCFIYVISVSVFL